MGQAVFGGLLWRKQTRLRAFGGAPCEQSESHMPI
jgi:hypothetical protein